MNKKQLMALGMTNEAADVAIACIKNAASAGFFSGKTVRAAITDVLANPPSFEEDNLFGSFAKALKKPDLTYTPPEPLKFPVFGSDIDPNALDQMKVACQTPVAVGGAVMPDCHLGYGLPVGGVLATKGNVIPYAVGVDVACRIAFSVLDIPITEFEKNPDKLGKCIQDGSVFGMGGEWKERHNHKVMDMDWSVTPVTRQLKDRAWSQLGTSGSGNHFVDLGILTLATPQLGLNPGKYMALMSHSGSRGTGAQVCKTYNDIAVRKLEPKYKEYFKNLAWLSLDSQEGQEYWKAMNLMGEYASANHACIHFEITSLLGARVLAKVENHHNFAWLEKHGGEEVVVHRKGATPAGEGVLGVIPGSMADPAYIVRGKGLDSSLNSASHGAGRRMSRRQGLKEMDREHWKGVLRQRGVKLLSGGADELPGVYKDIKEVMAQQTDLVDIIGEFHPRIVKMADDGTSED